MKNIDISAPSELLGPNVSIKIRVYEFEVHFVKMCSIKIKKML